MDRYDRKTGIVSSVSWNVYLNGKPVLDKNGTPCMYDNVTDQFFYNAGTGQFIAGPVIYQ